MHSLRRCIKTLDPSFRWGDVSVFCHTPGKPKLAT
jgi:hypothetical protein